LSAKGFEGTVLGTLVMPYCTAWGNLIFAFILGSNGGLRRGCDDHSLVTNITNMTLVLGLPPFYGQPGSADAKERKQSGQAKRGKLNRLSLFAHAHWGFVFTGAVLAMGRNG